MYELLLIIIIRLYYNIIIKIKTFLAIFIVTLVVIARVYFIIVSQILCENCISLKVEVLKIVDKKK